MRTDGNMMSSGLVVGLALSLLALVLAVEAGSFAAANSFAGANSMAAAHSGNGRAASQAAAGVFVQPQVSQVRRQTSSTSVDEARRARNRQARALRQTLVQLEALPTNSLAECDDWASLNDRYNTLVGGSGNRKLRQGEAIKADECNALHFATSRTRARFDYLRSLFEAERGQVGFVGGLLAEYLDLTRRIAQDETLAKSYMGMVQNEPEILRGVQNLEQLLEFVREQTRGDEGARGRIGARGHNLDELHDSVRQLVFKENHLDDKQLGQLSELADLLEEALAGQRHIPVESGRFRYLSGVLDAARAVLVHRLGEQPVESSRLETSFVAEHGERQPVAEQFLGESHEYHEEPQSSYAFAGTYGDHDEQEALEQEALEQEAFEREAAERDEAKRMAAAEQFRNAYEQPKSARSVVADVLAQADRANAEADAVQAARQQASKVVAASARAADLQQQAPQQPLVQTMATAATSAANGQTFSGQQAQQVRSPGPNSVNNLVSRLRQRSFSASSNGKAANSKFD